MTKKLPVKAVVRIRAYDVVADAVEAGIETGWRHAHKHVSDPTPDALRGQIYTDVMNALCSVLDFDPQS